MKLGSENRRNLVALAVLLPLAFVAFYFGVLRSGGTAPAKTTTARAAADSTAPAAPRRRSDRPTGPTVRVAPSLDPMLRLDLLGSVETNTYEGRGRNIFEARAEEIEIPKPVASARKETAPLPEQPVNTGPPPPPPINLKFFGFANRPGEPRRIFLSQGEDVFVGGEGDIVARRYRIVRITQNAVEIEDTLNNNRQTIPLTQG